MNYFDIFTRHLFGGAHNFHADAIYMMLLTNVPSLRIEHMKQHFFGKPALQEVKPFKGYRKGGVPLHTWGAHLGWGPLRICQVNTDDITIENKGLRKTHQIKTAFFYNRTKKLPICFMSSDEYIELHRGESFTVAFKDSIFFNPVVE